jgi:hypothetical protein
MDGSRLLILTSMWFGHGRASWPSSMRTSSPSTACPARIRLRSSKRRRRPVAQCRRRWPWPRRLSGASTRKSLLPGSRAVRTSGQNSKEASIRPPAMAFIRQRLPACRTLNGNAAGQEGCAGGVSRMTRPVKILVRGRQPGQATMPMPRWAGHRHDQTDSAGSWRLSERHRTIVLGSVPRHFPTHVMGAYRRLYPSARLTISEQNVPHRSAA